MKWTEEEIAYLRSYSSKKTLKELSNILDIDYHAVKYKVKMLGLNTIKEWRKWNIEEIDFLTRNYLNLCYSEIGKKLNKSKRAIGQKVRDLGLKKEGIISKSEILRDYFSRHEIHLKGKKLPQKTKLKLSVAMKRYLERENVNVLRKIRKKQIETRIKRGSQSGKNHPWYGKKRPDFAKIGREQWKNLEHRKKVAKAISKSSINGSKNQKLAYKYLCKEFGRKNVGFNDWKILEYKREIDIPLYHLKVAVEWDGQYWHQNIKTKKKDLIKNGSLTLKGWKFIRINDSRLNTHEVLKISSIVSKLAREISNSNRFKHTAGIYI